MAFVKDNTTATKIQIILKQDISPFVNTISLSLVIFLEYQWYLHCFGVMLYLCFYGYIIAIQIYFMTIGIF